MPKFEIKELQVGFEEVAVDIAYQLNYTQKPRSEIAYKHVLFSFFEKGNHGGELNVRHIGKGISFEVRGPSNTWYAYFEYSYSGEFIRATVDKNDGFPCFIKIREALEKEMDLLITKGQ